MAEKKKAGRATPKKKAAQQEAARPVTQASQWKGKSKALASPLTVPSGNVCLVKRPGLEVFLQKGVVPNSLLALLQKAAAGKGIEDKMLQKGLGDLLADPEKLVELTGFADAVLMECVVEPHVWPVPLWTIEDAAANSCDPDEVGMKVPDHKRNPDRLYVDYVEMQDKMFVFNWAVGGDASVENFREEQGKLVESLSDGEDVGNDS